MTRAMPSLERTCHRLKRTQASPEMRVMGMRVTGMVSMSLDPELDELEWEVPESQTTVTVTSMTTARLVTARTMMPELRYLKPTCVNVLFGDGTRRAKADRLYAIEGEVESDSAGEDDDSHEESEEEGDDGDVEMADSDDDDDSKSGEDDEAE